MCLSIPWPVSQVNPLSEYRVGQLIVGPTLGVCFIIIQSQRLLDGHSHTVSNRKHISPIPGNVKQGGIILVELLTVIGIIAGEFVVECVTQKTRSHREEWVILVRGDVDHPESWGQILADNDS